MENKRIEWIDIAKGIGIILVIIGHISYNEKINWFIFSFHMPLFFIISGYLYKNKENFVKKRVKSILIPYIIFSIITYLYWATIERRIRNQNVNLLKAFFNIFVAQAGEKNYPFNAVMWFLPCLFITELIFNFIEKKGTKFLTVLIILFSITGYVYPKITKFRLPFCMDVAMVAIVFYYLGYMLKNKQSIIKIDSKGKLKFGIIGLIVTLVLSIIEHGANLNELKYNNFILFYITAIVGTYSIFIISMKLRTKSIKFLGRNSLIIMCTHEPIKRIVIMLSGKILNIQNDILRQNILSIMIITFITIVATMPLIISINKYCPQILGKTKEEKNAIS